MENIDIEKIKLELEIAISMLLTTDRYKSLKREELINLIKQSVEVITHI